MNGTRFNYEDYAYDPSSSAEAKPDYFFTATPQRAAATNVEFVAVPHEGVLHRPVGELIENSVLSKPVGELLADSVLSKPVGEVFGRRRRVAG